jgi:hypothetical protein
LDHLMKINTKTETMSVQVFHMHFNLGRGIK